MHINDAYEHTPILPFAEDAIARQATPVTSCAKTATQCVNVSKSLSMTPTAEVGTVTSTCSGNPTVICYTNTEGTACTVTVTQRVCATIPVTFGVAHTEGDAGISCADGGDTGCGCGCVCGCS